MTIRQHLNDKVNAYIAKELWQKISTEYDDKVMHGGLGDEHERFPWLVKRAKELLKEYTDGKETEN